MIFKMADRSTLLSSAEIKLAQKLASNDKTIRDRAVKKLKSWIETRSSSRKNPFTRDDFLKIWKGLHYCMWMSDKPLIQEELSANLAALVHMIRHVDTAFLFMEVFFETEAREWYGIDRWRLDKFLMLYRQFVGQCLQYLKKHTWNDAIINKWIDLLKKGTLSATDIKTPDSLKNHMADIYLEELKKAGVDELSEEQMLKFLDPYCLFLSQSKNPALMRQIKSQVFWPIIQESAVGLNDEELEKLDAEDASKRFKMDYAGVSEMLMSYGSSEQCRKKNRAFIYEIVKKFNDLASGIFPVEEISSGSEAELKKDDYEKAIKDLNHFESSLFKDNKPEKKKKRKKQKKDKSAEINIEDDDDVVNQPVPKKMKKMGAKKSTAAVDDNSSDEDDAAGVEKPKLKRKKKKSKRHSSLNVPESNEGTAADANITLLTKDVSVSEAANIANVKSQDKDEAVSSVSNDAADDSKTSSAKKKLKKKKLNVDANSSSFTTINTSLTDKKDDVVGSSLSSNIITPDSKINKKKRDSSVLKGKLETSSNGMDGTVDLGTPLAKKVKKKDKVKKCGTDDELVTFSKTPSTVAHTFFKKAASKYSKGSTSPGLSNVLEKTPNSRKKNVRFGKNSKQDFSVNSLLSPGPVFDPNVNPKEGILKSPVNTNRKLSGFKIENMSDLKAAKRRKSLGPTVIDVLCKKGKKKSKRKSIG